MKSYLTRDNLLYSKNIYNIYTNLLSGYFKFIIKFI